MLHYAMIEKFVTTLVEALRKVELNSTFQQTVFATCLETFLAVARYVTLGNVSYNFVQVVGNIAQCNRAFIGCI